MMDRLYASLLRQRDEMAYNIERTETWLAEKRAELARIEARITAMEPLRKGGEHSF
ncbi:hypothetical protein M6D81_11420 [Paenibacillus sp. J5C_2022]|uniref:hypothetical protein n=1 Tax=Paenibacillus sp. J5C2022 TaxID=2977129 RepID=UPI0021D24E17|nr:hypothetical protein [Paenibacillus sp. J5C2022]MCU6709316.1 hypothetical protein [Paenibacillus sp. J5C2022]